MPNIDRSYIGVAFAILLLVSNTLQASDSQPDAPDNLRGSIDGTSASLKWDAPADNATVAGFNVYINDQYTDTVFGNGFITKVKTDTPYSFYVVAFDDEEPRQYSQASDILTLPDSFTPDDLTVPPSIPEALTGNVDGTTVTLKWNPSTDDELVLGYNVYRDGHYLTTVSGTTYSGVNERDESHEWYVVAFDIRKNYSARSESIIVPSTGGVNTAMAPTVPSGLTGNVVPGDSSDAVTLTWDPSTDDQSVAGYNIYQNEHYIATRFDTLYEGTVQSGSKNSFSVVAFDEERNFSTSSNAITLQTETGDMDPGVPPTVPVNLAGVATISNGQTQARLTWTASTSRVGVAGYNIYRNDEYHATVFTNAFSEEVAVGTPLAYSVVAFDDFDNFSPRSETVNLLVDTNQAPIISELLDQTLTIDEPWELLLRATDSDGGSAGIIVSTLPAGAELLDNGDGTRLLKWTPLIADIGAYDLTVTAVDSQDDSLRSSQEIILNVIDIDRDPSRENIFSLAVTQGTDKLQEGDAAGINVPVTVSFNDANSPPVTLSISGVGSDDNRGISTSFSRESLSPADNTSELNLKLAIDVLPIFSGQRSFTVTASDGTNSAQSTLTVDVTSVARDDVYLLIGQSNMVGVSETGAKQAGAGGADEPNMRIRQANVVSNNADLYANADAFTSVAVNFRSPVFVTAQDPLHDPVDPNDLSKNGTEIGMGLSMAKSALRATSRSIVLVPAAWGGTGFCDSSSRPAQWNARPTSQPELGNTLLFDRALTRVNETLLETGGILRGIIWHQGEDDSNSACAQFYEQNLTTMVSEFRSRIIEDMRGSDARGPSANIPFVVGTMSKGVDDRGDFSSFNAPKSVVDSVHRNIAGIIPFSEVVLNDDLVPANGFPCGGGSCIHFGASALREMGARSYEALVRAAGN